MTLHSVFEKSLAPSLLFLMRIVSPEDDVIFHKLLLWERKRKYVSFGTFFRVWSTKLSLMRPTGIYEVVQNRVQEILLETNHPSRSNTIVPAFNLRTRHVVFFFFFLLVWPTFYCIRLNGWDKPIRLTVSLLSLIFCFEAFRATEFNIIFWNWQPRQVVQI